MTTLSHILAGYVATSATQKIWSKKLTSKQTYWLLLYGPALSIVMDLDVMWSDDLLITHHQEIFHMPSFWIMVSLGIALVGYTKKHLAFFAMGGITFMITSLHLFMDAFGVSSGIYPFAPFSTYEFAFTRLVSPLSGPLSATKYVASQPSIWGRELLVIGLGLMYTFRHKEEITSSVKMLKGNDDHQTPTRDKQPNK